jgi:hypothetical protein
VLARDWLAPGLRVRNAGVMGYGIAQHVQRLEELADRIQPGDLVVFAPISSDIERSLKNFRHASKYVFHKEKGNIQGFPDLRDGKLVTAPFDTWRNRLRALAYNAEFTGGGLRRIHHWLAPPHAIEDARALMAIARHIVEERGARFAWLFLPDPRECLSGEYRVDVSTFEFPDLMSYFPSDPDGVAAIHFPNDPHWNERGHALAARAVAEALRDTGALQASELAAEPGLAARRKP